MVECDAVGAISLNALSNIPCLPVLVRDPFAENHILSPSSSAIKVSLRDFVSTFICHLCRHTHMYINEKDEEDDGNIVRDHLNNISTI